MTKPPFIADARYYQKFVNSWQMTISTDVRQGEIHAPPVQWRCKSTLMNMLSGLLQPTSGTIMLKNKR